MRTGSLLFLAGILTLVQFRELPSPYFLFFLPFCPLLIWKSRLLSRPAFFTAGFLWALLRADVIISGRLAPELEGKTVIIEGTVTGLPLFRNSGLRFDFNIVSLTDARGNPRQTPGRTRLSWYGRYPVLKPGTRWRLKVRLKRPHGFMNPGGFDYEGWLFQQGIAATGYVLQDHRVNRHLHRVGSISVHRSRFELRRHLQRYLGTSPAGALVMALAIGDRSGLSTSQWGILTRTGTSHLLAISGLHIGIIAGLGYVLTRCLWPFTGLLLLGIATPRAAAFVSLAAAVSYAALAGFAIPTQRALIMLGIVLSLLYRSRRTSMSHVIGLTLLLVLCLDPFSIMAVGFWLSFNAVTVILYTMGHRAGTAGSLWWRWGRVQICIALGLLPLLAYLFQQVPLTGMITNCVAIPWVSLISLPLILSGALLTFLNDTAAQFVLDMALHSLEILWIFLEAAAHYRFIVIHVPEPAWFALLTGIAGAVLLMLPAGLPGRWLGLIWLCPMLIPSGYHPPLGDFRLTLMDVGQGLAVIVQTRSHILVYDTGPRYSDSFNAGEDVLVPALRHMGITTLDTIVQSHGDNDHIGGLKSVLAEMPVTEVLTSVPGRVDFPNTVPCMRGQAWDWDGVHLEILHPPRDTPYTGNNGSCVLKISRPGYATLITGDIEKPVELDLVDTIGDKLAANLLIAPHHGSMTSSSPEFIDAVHPDLVLFAVGYRNRFGFPKQDIISRYRMRGIRTLDTARSGAIEVTTGTGGIEIVRYRRRLHRFWQIAD